MSNLIKSDPDSIGTAITKITAGQAISIPLSEKPQHLNDINALGYTLLSNALAEMTPYEIGFAASMIKQQNSLTNKQRSYLGKLAMKYLGVDIDGATVPMSAPASERATLPANDDAKPARRKAGRK